MNAADVLKHDKVYYCSWHKENEWYVNHIIYQDNRIIGTPIATSIPGNMCHQLDCDFDDLLDDKDIIIEVTLPFNKERYPELYI